MDSVPNNEEGWKIQIDEHIQKLKAGYDLLKSSRTRTAAEQKLELFVQVRELLHDEDREIKRILDNWLKIDYGLYRRGPKRSRLEKERLIIVNKCIQLVSTFLDTHQELMHLWNQLNAYDVPFNVLTPGFSVDDIEEIGTENEIRLNDWKFIEHQLKDNNQERLNDMKNENDAGIQTMVRSISTSQCENSESSGGNGVLISQVPCPPVKPSCLEQGHSSVPQQRKRLFDEDSEIESEPMSGTCALISIVIISIVIVVLMIIFFVWRYKVDQQSAAQKYHYIP